MRSTEKHKKHLRKRLLFLVTFFGEAKKGITKTHPQPLSRGEKRLIESVSFLNIEFRTRNAEFRSIILTVMFFCIESFTAVQLKSALRIFEALPAGQAGTSRILKTIEKG